MVMGEGYRVRGKGEKVVAEEERKSAQKSSDAVETEGEKVSEWVEREILRTF